MIERISFLPCFALLFHAACRMYLPAGPRTAHGPDTPNPLRHAYARPPSPPVSILSARLSRPRHAHQRDATYVRSVSAAQRSRRNGNPRMHEMLSRWLATRADIHVHGAAAPTALLCVRVHVMYVLVDGYMLVPCRVQLRPFWRHPCLP